MGPPATPIKALGLGSSPAKSFASPASASSSSLSPSKPSSTTKRDDKDRDDDEQLDTKSLLERMKETVEGMKRRSMAPATPVRGGASPVVSVNKGELTTPARVGPALPRLGFGHRVNARTGEVGMVGVEETDESEKDEVKKTDSNFAHDQEGGEEKEGAEREVFSLLRPGVMEEVRTREEVPIEVPEIVLPDDEDIVTAEEPTEKAGPTSAVLLPVPGDDDGEELNVPKSGARARLLRRTKRSPSPAPYRDEAAGPNVTIIAFPFCNRKLSGSL